jgi:hypothetical protein
MNCEFGNRTLDDYFDHQLDAMAQATLLAHCRHCAECRTAVDQHTQYLLRLKQFKLALPQMEKGFGDSPTPAGNVPLLIKPTMNAAWYSTNLLRMAAAVATFAAGISLFYASREESAVDVAQDSGDVWSKVNIVIQVPTDFHDAKLTVSLPKGIYVEGFEGVKTLAWNADFTQGTNAFELPVFIDGASFDRQVPQYLDATLEYQGTAKTFEFLVGVDANNTTL